MNCPKCNTEMKKGILVQHGGYWTENSEDRKTTKLLFVKSDLIPVLSWKCPKCFKIELAAEQ